MQVELRQNKKKQWTASIVDPGNHNILMTSGGQCYENEQDARDMIQGVYDSAKQLLMITKPLTKRRS